MNILHVLKHDFLIIGLTGPLRAGCTTAAKFFAGNINQAIEQYLNQYDIIQTLIQKSYENIASSKETDECANLEVERHELKELLKEREVIKVLEDYPNNGFLSISMTDILLKILIEKGNDVSPGVGQEKKGVIQKIQKVIRDDFQGMARFKQLSKLVAERRFSEFRKEDFLDYENYLDKITKLRDNIMRLDVSRELIGELMQDFGDNIRRCGNPLDYSTAYCSDSPTTIFSLASEANNLIKFYRSIYREKTTGQERIKQFVIEAFRNPYEIEFFRNRYYEFYLISLFAELDIRQHRDSSFSKGRDNRDKGEGVGIQDFYKQNVSECVRIADIAVNNEGNPETLHKKLMTYFALIKQPGCFAPRWKETAMHMAYSMSVRSTCISRQVGAVIEGANGYIVGAGWNDVGVGQIGCGYRHYEDYRGLNPDALLSNPPGEDAFRKMIDRYGENRESFCYKDKYSQYTIRKKLKKIEKDIPGEKKRITLDQRRIFVEKLQEEINVKMMQYCRALHAEENAILQTAVIGGMGIKDGVIYTTTFPCELCAKKIYQSGIRKVVYTEPYPRSISKDVFFQDGIRSIEFEQFEGVKSQSYFRLYKAAVDKKEFQMLQHIDKSETHPTFRENKV